MTKQEILKTHKMTEQEFYKKFPTQEAYNQFQMGGTLPPKQKFHTGGFTPLLPAANVPANLTAPVPHFTPGTSAPAAATPAAAPGGFKLPDMSKVSTGGGQQAPQQAGSDPNAPVQKNTGKTIGSVAGGIAGSFIPIPGVGTMIGGAVGGAIGGAVDKKTYENKMEEYSANKSSQQNAMTSNIAGNFNPNAQGKTFKMGGNLIKRADGSYSQRGLWDNIRANKGSGKQPTKEMLAQEKKIKGNEYKMGGNFTEYHGNTHENGGIPIGQSEVEGGETNNNGYIYSDTLKLGKKTFADISKKINNKYSRRPDDKISMESKERELGNLAKMQESTGLTNNSRGMFQGGGKFNPNNPMSDDRATLVSGNFDSFGAGKPVSGSIDAGYSPNKFSIDPKEGMTVKPFTYKTPGSLGYDTPKQEPGSFNIKPPTADLEASKFIGETKGKYNYNPTSPVDTNKPLQTKVNPLGYLASAIGPAYNIAQGLKGGDPVNFDRMTSKYQYADPRGAMAAANRGITAAYNPVKNAAKNTTTSAGEYLANMTNIASKEGMERAATMASIKGQSDIANTQGLNQSNLVKDQYNAQAQMQNAIAQQQENDAAISSISQGLNNFGQNTLGYGQDVAMNKTQNTMLPLLADGYEYVIDADGKVSAKKKISGTDNKYQLTPSPVIA
jgi:hypothetical protein